MQIHDKKCLGRDNWYFEIRSGNNKLICQNEEDYASKRNALATANLIAKKLKVVVEE